MHEGENLEDVAMCIGAAVENEHLLLFERNKKC